MRFFGNLNEKCTVGLASTDRSADRQIEALGSYVIKIFSFERNL